MEPTTAQWLEIAFDVSYLLALAWLIGLMSVRMTEVGSPQHDLQRRFRDGFLFLAIGDLGHLGARVLAFFEGGLETELAVGRSLVPVVGVGALATAVGITFLSMLLLDAWRIRFKQPRELLYWWLMSLGVVRLLLFIPAQNQWGQVVPPLDWSLVRNLPLAVLGVAVGVLMIRHGRRLAENTFTWLGALILVSFAFYAPVILLVQRWPAVGALMALKTIAYVAMAGLAYTRLFKPHGRYDVSPRRQLLHH